MSASSKAWSARTLAGIADIDATAWDRLANPPGRAFNPFVAHAFLHALEASGSATAETGWMASHVVVEEGDGDIVAAMPCYIKSHSRGEYVFDYGWAEAFERAGGRYYPKLQCSVPFTPATGPRLIAGAGENAQARRALAARAGVAVCDRLGLSSLHITFMEAEQCDEISGAQWLKRTDTQFHWHNRDYGDFEDFLARLSSRKRKNIRRERRIVAGHDVRIETLVGEAITARHWDQFFDCYLATGAQKWGTPYLTREFFERVHASMGERIVLIAAFAGDDMVAGALNFIGDDALYGRNWGALAHYDCLHFEVCYYRAIEFAIAHGLARIEAGAQGPHKLARGYAPSTTYSAHHIANPAFARAVAEYLRRERRLVERDQQFLAAHAPYRHGDEEEGF